MHKICIYVILLSKWQLGFGRSICKSIYRPGDQWGCAMTITPLSQYSSIVACSGRQQKKANLCLIMKKTSSPPLPHPVPCTYLHTKRKQSMKSSCLNQSLLNGNLKSRCWGTLQEIRLWICKRSFLNTKRYTQGTCTPDFTWVITLITALQVTSVLFLTVRSTS